MCQAFLASNRVLIPKASLPEWLNSRKESGNEESEKGARYRVGGYHFVAHIEDGALRILVLKVGNRREVYR